MKSFDQWARSLADELSDKVEEGVVEKEETKIYDPNNLKISWGGVELEGFFEGFSTDPIIASDKPIDPDSLYSHKDVMRNNWQGYTVDLSSVPEGCSACFDEEGYVVVHSDDGGLPNHFTIKLVGVE